MQVGVKKSRKTLFTLKKKWKTAPISGGENTYEARENSQMKPKQVETTSISIMCDLR